MINQSEARPLSRSLPHVCIVRYTIERSPADRRDHQEPSLQSFREGSAPRPDLCDWLKGEVNPVAELPFGSSFSLPIL